jgi:DNA-binding transcriptional MocR family regulator
VIVESPSYLGAINAFKAYECRFIEVKTDENGMDITDLEEKIKSGDRIKMIYVIPDFQNPSGRTWSLERRKKLIEIANRYDLPIVEDNPYGELRFEGEAMPPIKSLDTEGRVIYLGTFSKTFSPGLRIGWVMASPEVLNKYIQIKQGADLQTNTMSQRELALFLDQYDLDEHIEKIIAVYRRRRDLMFKTMEESFPEGVEWTHPEGGLFLWVTLPEHMNTKELMEKAVERKVAFVPGGSFFPNGGVHNTMRINYSTMPDDKIVEGIRRLGSVIAENM